MPNTKSAAKRARQCTQRQARNQNVKSKLKTLETRYLSLVKEGNKDEAGKALKAVSSALDKAAKRGIIHGCKGNRKKSRLAVQLKAAK
jgi:small subunit ribosomal protein S20